MASGASTGTDPFVGRVGELSVLDSALSAAQAGEGTALVSGDPGGAGRSRYTGTVVLEE